MSGDGADSPSRKLLVATGSRHKLDELRHLLDLPGTDLLSLADLGLTDSAVEDGATFEANARLKAVHYSRLSGMPTLADDSGIEVDALDGRPGVFTRRYAGPDATDEQNNDRLLEELAGLPAERRGARYRCVLVFIDDNGHEEVTTGTLEGSIALGPRGSNGFGYDPLFEPLAQVGAGRTVGEMSTAEKGQISHRAQAARSMRELLIARGY